MNSCLNYIYFTGIVHPCKICGICFSYAKYLVRHNMYCRDNSASKWKCEICQKGFSSASCLFYHRIIHSGEKPYKCNKCGKAFIRQKNWSRHMRVHTGEKPYKCDKCGKAFSQQYNLNRHMRVHTGEKPYKM